MNTQTTIAEALRHFGFEDAGTRETCMIAAVIDRFTDSVLVCDVISPLLYGDPVRRCEFLRSAVRAEFYGPSSALIEIPKTYLPIFVLWDFVQPERSIARYRERIAEFNAPYLPPSPVRKAEKVGGVRI